MSNSVVELPTPYFGDPNQSRPIFNGSVFIGNIDTDPEIEANRKTVTLRQEDGTEVEITAEGQPLLTGSGGYVLYNGSTVTVLVDGAYSLKVLNKSGDQEYYFANVFNGAPATIDQVVLKFDTLADAVASTIIYETAALNIAERTTGNGGGAMWDVVLSTTVTENTFNIVQGVGVGTLSLVLRTETIANVKQFGAVADGSNDDIGALEAARDSGVAELYFPKGRYGISRTFIMLQNEQVWRGDVAGAYFSGTGFDRGSAIVPLSGFSDTDIVRADPADTSASAVYRFGVGMEHMNIDLDNVATGSKVALRLNSVTNAESFSNIRIGNNDNGVQIIVGKSANGPALESDGLEFNNVVTIYKTVGATTANPLVILESCNEILFNFCKILGPDASTSGTDCVKIEPTAGNTVNAVTFRDCSFTGMENGTRIISSAATSQGPRWIRWDNCTFEGPKFMVATSADSTRPIQFLTFGEGNRWQTTQSGGIGVNFTAYTTNSVINIDDFLPTGATESANFNTTSGSNVIFGPPGQITDTGTNNCIMGRSAGEYGLTMAGQNSIFKIEAKGGFGAQVQAKSDSAEWDLIAFGTGSANTGKFRILKDGTDLAIELDNSATASETRMSIYDVDNAQLEKITVGAADSGGSGFKVLRIPN